MTQIDSRKWYKSFMVVENFLLNLRALMAANRDLTQHQLASLSGIPRGRIGSWISRKTIPGPEDIEKLAKAFNVEPYYFFMKPGTQGDVKPLEREDNFRAFMDELAEKHLGEIDKAAYYHYGGASQYIRTLRGNLETTNIGYSDWYQILNREFAKYVNLDILEKIRSDLAKNRPEVKKSESA